MSDATIPVLSLRDPREDLSHNIGNSFRQFGFAMVCDHGIDAELVKQGWHQMQAYFALSEEQKRQYYVPSLAGARGYTPFGTEIAKDAAVHDLKEFWHVGRQFPADHPLNAIMAQNIWPHELTEFRETFEALYAAFDRVGDVILEAIALDLGLTANWFEDAVRDGNSVLRLAHYPPLANDPGDALRAGPHEDINLITLLLGAEEAGLQLLSKEGKWLEINPPAGAMVINIGDMLQRLTNHVLPSTTHRVRNPDNERARNSRYSMPFFLHPRNDFFISTLPQCISADNADRYAGKSISADDYLTERLREIGLIS